MFPLPFATLGEIISHRRLYLIGIVLFTLVIAQLCVVSLAHHAGVVEGGGVGAAPMMSVNTTLVRLIYPKRFWGAGWVSMPRWWQWPRWPVRPSLAASWQWRSGPGCLLSMCPSVCWVFLSRRYLPDNPVKVHNHHFDFVGSVLSVFTFGLMMVTVESLSHGWGAFPLQCWPFCLFCRLSVCSQPVAQALPILPLRPWCIPIFSLSVLTSICSFVAQMLAMIALPSICSADTWHIPRCGGTGHDFVAGGHHGGGARGWLSGRAYPCRGDGCGGFVRCRVGFFCWLFAVGGSHVWYLFAYGIVV